MWHEWGTRPAQNAADAEENEESVMNNYYTIESEAEFRRREWQRVVEADARAAQASPRNGRKHRPHLSQLSLASLRSLVVPRLPFSSALAPRRRGVAC